MIYADLPAGATVFVDAGVFIHHFEPNALDGPAATEFLERTENQDIPERSGVADCPEQTPVGPAGHGFRTQQAAHESCKGQARTGRGGRFGGKPMALFRSPERRLVFPGTVKECLDGLGAIDLTDRCRPTR